MRRRFIAVSLFGLLFALGWWAGRGRASADLYARLDTFVEILHKVEESYVEPVEPGRLIRGAVHGMLRDLDPYAEFVETRTGSRPRESGEPGLGTTSGEDAGDVGLTLGARDNAWVVIAPSAAGPAERAGVRAGDVLLQVEGRSAASWTRAETALRLRGPRGSRVRLTLLRPGEETPREVNVARAPMTRPARPEAQLIEKGIGYVRLAAIGDSTVVELRSILRRLRAAGVTRLAIDLRSCATGSIREGADLAQLFLPPGLPITLTRGRSGDSELKREASDPVPLLDWPVVAIVDGGCAGAAEIVAGALQDDDRALLVGRTTFGLASGQSDFPLEGGNALVRFTTTVQLTPSGRPIQPSAGPTSDDDEEAVGADSGATDPAARRTYLTRAGRKVTGGGGIRPDIEVAADSTFDAAIGAATADRPGLSAGQAISDPMVRQAIVVLRRSRVPRDVFAALPAAAGP